jgi:hypothetical protein
VKESLLSLHCWKCGLPGHTKSECTRVAIATVPQAMLATDVLPVMSTTGAPSFRDYCSILSQHIQDAVTIEVVDTGLVSKRHETVTTRIESLCL